MNKKQSPYFLGGNAVASHSEYMGSIPGLMNYMFDVFLGFSSTVKRIPQN